MKISDKEDVLQNALHTADMQPSETVSAQNDSGEILFQNAGVRIIVTPITSYAENEKFLTASERNYLNTYGSSHRRDEGSTWRAALRRHTACGETAYADNGAPSCTSDNNIHISISHTSRKAAIIISDKKCGIDIELRQRNFARIAARYMTPEEALMPNDFGSSWAGTVWCAKECLYKLAGYPNLDFRRDMKILNVSDNTLSCSISCPTTSGHNLYTLNVLFIEDHICVWGTV